MTVYRAEGIGKLYEDVDLEMVGYDTLAEAELDALQALKDAYPEFNEIELDGVVEVTDAI